MAVFETLALKCAPAIALDLLAAIVSVESGFVPMAVIAEGQRMEARSAGEAVAAAIGVVDRGKPVGIGLAGIDQTRLAGTGISIVEAFDGCRNLAAAEMLLTAAFAQAEGKGGAVSPKAAESLVIRSWWREDGRFPTAAAYERAVQVQRRRSEEIARTEVRSAEPRPVKPAVRAGEATRSTPSRKAGGGELMIYSSE